jgi:hypothetical protein
MNPPPDRFTDLYDTPEGRALHESIYAQHHAVIHDRKATPSQMSAAGAKFRQERFIDAGKEGWTGGGASCYHLDKLCSKVASAAYELRIDNRELLGHPVNRLPRNLVQYLGHVHGYRYLVGVRGLTDALREAGVSPAQLGWFMLERDKFNREFLPLADAAFMVNARGENPNAAIQCAQMLIDELTCLCGWLELTAERYRSPGMRTELHEASLNLARFELKTGEKLRGKRRQR